MDVEVVLMLDVVAPEFAETVDVLATVEVLQDLKERHTEPRPR